MNTNAISLFPAIAKEIEGFSFSAIAEERKKYLHLFIDYLIEKVKKKEPIRLSFICTHNSRRSHLSQAWAQVLSVYYGISLLSYSAGTEATALYPSVLKALERSGFQVIELSKGENPIYGLKYAELAHPMVGFSKVLAHPFNPQRGFAAILTCSQADEACPFVNGAEARISLPFEDPKVADQSPEEEAKYTERSLEIAAELAYVFSSVAYALKTEDKF